MCRVPPESPAVASFGLLAPGLLEAVLVEDRLSHMRCHPGAL